MSNFKAIPKGHEQNLTTIIRAAKNGDLALVSAKNERDEDVVLMCAVVFARDGSAEIVPLAQMFTGNPYEQYRIQDEGEV